MSNEQKQGGGLSKAAQAAQLARAAAEIIQGALSGGLHGAAAAAVKSFAPQLIKIAVVIIICLLLIPSIIFLALPSYLFGLPSVEAEDIQEMNAQATRVESLYGQMGGFTREEADKIVARLAEGYDDVVVTSDFSNINDYWLAAIATVLNDQSLEVGESDVRGMLVQNIDYSYTTDTYTVVVGTDENGDDITVTKHRIYIDIGNTPQDALMTALGFTGEQREWAYFLYSNLTDPQLVTPDDPNYPADGGINYGDLVFTGGSTDVVYYNQTDARWGSKMYGKYHTIAVGGCGPTSMAMVVSSMTSTTILPDEMAEWAVDNGYCAQGNGSYHALIPDAAKNWGLRVEGAGTRDGQKVIDALSGGKLVVALMGPGHFTTSGHFIVLRGVTEEGKILVADPVSTNKSGREWDMSILLGEASRKAVAGGPFWIIG